MPLDVATARRRARWHLCELVGVGMAVALINITFLFADS